MEQTVKLLQEKCEQLVSFVAAQKETNKMLGYKLDGLTKSNEILLELVSDIKVIAVSLRTQGTAIEKLSNDVDELKSIPSQRFDRILYIIIAGAVGVICGLITSRLTLGV